MTEPKYYLYTSEMYAGSNLRFEPYTLEEAMAEGLGISGDDVEILEVKDNLIRTAYEREFHWHKTDNGTHYTWKAVVHDPA